MPASPSRIKNTTITLVTLAVLALATFGYFYFYIQQREDALQARHYRVLNQMRQNILALNDTYLKNAGNNAAKDLQQLQNQAAVMYNDRLQLNNERVARGIEALAGRYGVVSSPLKDSLKAYLLDKFTVQLITSEDVSLKGAAFEIGERFLTRKCDNSSIDQPFQVNDSTGVFVRDCQSVIVEQNGIERSIDFINIPDVKLEITFEEFDDYYKQKINLNYKLREYENTATGYRQSILRKAPDGWELVYTDTILTREGAYEFELTRPFDDLISKVLREDIFDEFVVYRVLQDSAAIKSRNSKYESIFQTFEENFFSRQLAGEMDSLLSRQLDSEKRHNISGVPFRIYLQPLHLLRGEELFVCGLVDQGQFESEKARIPPLIILFIVLAVFMVLLAFPSLKLLLMSKHESLSVSDLFLSLISLIMGTSMVVLMLFNGYRVFLEDEKQRKGELEGLHQEISEALFAELKDIHTQLKHYDTLEAAFKLPNPQEGSIMRVLSNPDDTLLYPRYYPYFNALLWATPDARIGKEITPRENPTPKVDITGRKYLERFRENQAWNLPYPEESKAFMLESILTRTTGDQLAVVSTNSQTQAPIVFLSTYLHSVIHPVMPLGYGFCILNQEGDVLFHSDKSRNLQENFLEECSLKDLRSTMYSRAALHAEGSYLGVDHNFYLKPLDKLPLFLITFENKSFYRMAHAQALSLNILFALAFLAFVLLFLALLYIFRPTASSLKHSSYVLDWLRPTQLNTNNYRRLFLMNLVILLALIFTVRQADDLTSIILILGSNFYVFVLAFFHLNRNSFKEFNWNKYWHISVALGLIFLVFNGVAALVKGVDFGKVLSFELIPVLFTVVVLESIVSKPLRRASVFKPISDRIRLFLTTEQQAPGVQRQLIALHKRWSLFLNHRRSYRFFLLSWLAFSSIFPALKFYQISYDHERKLLTQLTHIQLDKDIQKRNIRIDQLYRSIQPGDEFLRTLKHKGIYTKPYFNTSFDAPDSRNINLAITLLNPDSNFSDPAIPQEVVLYKDTLELFRLPDSLRTGQEVHSSNLFNDPLLTIQTAHNRTMGLHYSAHESANHYSIQGMIDRQQLKDWLKEDESLSLEGVQTELHHESEGLTYKVFRKDSDSLAFSGKAQIEVTFQLLRPNTVENDEASRSLASTLALFRPRFSETVRQTNQVNYDRSANELWYWINDDQRLFYFNNQQQHSISSVLSKYAFPSLFKKGGLGLLFWSIFMAGIFVLYKLLNFHINRLFAQDVINRGGTPLHSNIRLLLNTKEHVFLVVPPPPIVSDYFDILKWKASRNQAKTKVPQIIDMRQMEGKNPETEALEGELKINPDSPFLVLDYFDYQIEKPKIYKARMRVLTQLWHSYPDKQLIIISNKSQISSPGIKDETENEDGNTPEKHKILFWEEIMSGFVKIIYPVEEWTRLNNLQELHNFTQETPAFLQIVPAKVEQDSLVSGHNLGDLVLKKSRQGTFKYYIRKDGATNHKKADTKTFLLVHSNDEASSLSEKIDFVESKLEQNEHIHLLSTISPVELIKCYADANTEAKERWIGLLSEMTKCFVQINDFQTGPAERAQSRILKESVYSNYLQNIQKELMTQFGDGKTSEEQIIREIEIRAQLYYQALWASCSEQEKYIIHDVANDGIVNSKNREVFNRLLEKGLIVIRGDNPRLMNKSFRDFILTRIKPEDLQKMTKKVKEGSSWNQARVLITVVILALGAFVFYTQGDLIDSTLAFFTGLAAFVPFLREVVSNVSMPETNMSNFFPKQWRSKK